MLGNPPPATAKAETSAGAAAVAAAVVSHRPKDKVFHVESCVPFWSMSSVVGATATYLDSELSHRAYVHILLLLILIIVGVGKAYVAGFSSFSHWPNYPIAVCATYVLNYIHTHTYIRTYIHTHISHFAPHSGHMVMA